jgi:hypothetical protein
MGHELSFVRLVAQQTQQYSGSIKGAADKAKNKSTLYPTQGTNTLADQLKIVARLIAGGLKTKVYMVSLGGFDTHAGQVATTGGTETGTHANLLSKISVAVNAFQDDLKLLAIQDRVLGMTFSEFGRRIKSNDSLGTDHGAAAPMFIFGTKVNGGIYGTNPVIPNNPSGGDNIAMQTDFRSVYATLLKDWFGVSDKDLTSVMFKSFPILPIVNTTTPTGINDLAGDYSNNFSNYPNPADSYTNIRFNGFGEMVQIKLFEASGKELMVLVNETYSKGAHEVKIDTSLLPSGLYYYSMVSGQRTFSNKLMIKR